MSDEAETRDAGNRGRPAYRVLARKYRPTSFSELIGQDALVRTLSNAIKSGRIAQAFMLTGVRGVGKTTTARIIARALNCIGPDGTGGPTISPCGVCVHCAQIAEDRHVDVLEIDAASHNGVDDIRDIVDGVRYSPASARYKLYIVDEVHMLSKPAFNALLKTLEEPPETVKFVFATTEVRKVPITVLSRCQRFDLRRVDIPVLIEHFGRVCGQEGVTAEPDALALIARAADGSVRDGLSILDQAIALSGDRVEAAQVRDMLGLADRTVVIDLLDAALGGRPKDALDILGTLHAKGADPLVVLQDLLDLVHGLTRFKVVPESRTDPGVPEAERGRGADLADRLSIPALGRAWQLLLKGFGEVQQSPLPQQAVEMVIVRLAHAASLPTPGDLVRRLQGDAGGPVAEGRSQGAPPRASGAGPASAGGTGPVEGRSAPRQASIASVSALHAAPRASAPYPTASEPAASAPPPVTPPPTFRALAQLFADRREMEIYGHLTSSVHLVRYQPGLLEFRRGMGTPGNLAGRIQARLVEWTGRRWAVAMSEAPGDLTLSEQDKAAKTRDIEAAASHPLVRAVLEAFPGAAIREVRPRVLPDTPGDPDGEMVADGDVGSYLLKFEEDGEFIP